MTDEFGEEHAVRTPRRSAEIHVLGGNILLVAIRDVLSFASVYSDPFPADSTCVSFWLAQCELCRFVWHSVELRGCCCSAQCVLCESCPAHQVLVFLSLLTRQLILCTRLCVLVSRHGMHHGSRTSHVSISSSTVAEPVFV